MKHINEWNLFKGSSPKVNDPNTDTINKLINDINEDVVGLMKGNKLFKFLEEGTKIKVLEDVFKHMTAPAATEDEKKVFAKYKSFIIKELMWIHK